MARSGPLLTEAQWKKSRPCSPSRATMQRWSSVDRESPCAGRDSLDSAERGSLAGPAGEISASFDVLAAIARLGGAGHLVEYLANVSGRVKRAPAMEMERIVLDGSFAPAKKGAAESEKPSGTRGRSGWWWSTAAVFLWETTFTLHPRRKSNSRRRRSRRSA